MIIANTMFQKRWGRLWTHVQNGRKRQIDYLLVEKKRFRAVKDSEATKFLHLGSDHRSVRTVMDVGSAALKRRKRFKQRSDGNNIGWKPEAAKTYEKMLNQRLQDEIMMDRLCWVSRDVDDKLDILEKLVVGTASICKAVDEKLEPIPEKGDDTIQKLLQKRRGLDNVPESREARERKPRKLCERRKGCKSQKDRMILRTSRKS